MNDFYSLRRISIPRSDLNNDSQPGVFSDPINATAVMVVFNDDLDAAKPTTSASPFQGLSNRGIAFYLEIPADYHRPTAVLWRIILVSKTPLRAYKRRSGEAGENAEVVQRPNHGRRCNPLPHK
jgi:hypothetical protein